jgi:hypothetical protein
VGETRINRVHDVGRAKNYAARRTHNIMHPNPASRNWRKKGVLLASNHYRIKF